MDKLLDIISRKTDFNDIIVDLKAFCPPKDNTVNIPLRTSSRLSSANSNLESTQDRAGKSQTTSEVSRLNSDKQQLNTSEPEVSNSDLLRVIIVLMDHQKQLKDSLSETIHNMVKETREELEETKLKVTACENKILTQETKLIATEQQLNDQRKEIDRLLRNDYNRERSIRKNKVIISGPRINYGDKASPEELFDIARSGIHAVYGHDIPQVAISDVTRLTPKHNVLSGPPQKKIILTFMRYMDKDKLMSGVIQKDKRNGVGVHVNEFLTAEDSLLLFKLRNLRKKNPDRIQSCYSRNGTPYVKMTGETLAHSIHGEEDLSKLKAKYILTSPAAQPNE